jgi:hypothetical protein
MDEFNKKLKKAEDESKQKIAEMQGKIAQLETGDSAA